MSALNPVISAIYTKLTADNTLMSKISAVYDQVPESGQTALSYPYVVIDQADSNPFVTFSRFGESIQLDIFIYSKYLGFKEVNDIMSDLVRLLGNTSLSVTGYDTAACMYDSSNVDRLTDGTTRLGIYSARIMVQKN